MSGPSRAGLFLYAKDLEAVAGFYASVLHLTRVHSDAELVILQAQGMQLVVHAIPAHIASGITIASPPVRREKSAMKFFFTIPSLAAATAEAAARGGEVLTERWTGPGFRVANGCDPEGNVFQLREAIV